MRDFAERPSEDGGGCDGADELSGPVGGCPAPGKVPGERERERDIAPDAVSFADPLTDADDTEPDLFVQGWK